MGLDPESVGGTAAKASFARALVQRCLKLDAVPALARRRRGDRQAAVRAAAEADAATAWCWSPSSDPAWSSASYLIVEELGAGPTARIYRARRDGDDVRLRVLRGTVRRRDAERALVQARLCGNIAHAGLPDGVQSRALELAGQSLLTVAHDFVAGDVAGADRRQGRRPST